MWCGGCRWGGLRLVDVHCQYQMLDTESARHATWAAVLARETACRWSFSVTSLLAELLQQQCALIAEIALECGRIAEHISSVPLVLASRVRATASSCIMRSRRSSVSGGSIGGCWPPWP